MDLRTLSGDRSSPAGLSLSCATEDGPSVRSGAAMLAWGTRIGSPEGVCDSSVEDVGSPSSSAGTV
jgi:hypothetical protein